MPVGLFQSNPIQSKSVGASSSGLVEFSDMSDGTSEPSERPKKLNSTSDIPALNCNNLIRNRLHNQQCQLAEKLKDSFQLTGRLLAKTCMLDESDFNSENYMLLIMTTVFAKAYEQVEEAQGDW